MKCEKCKQEIKITKDLVVNRLREGYYKFSSDSVNEEFRRDLEAINYDLSYADLSEVDLRYANLWKADLSKADLSGADLSKANLSGADLSEAVLWKAVLLFCKMDKKVFKQITEGWFEWEVGE